MFYWDLAGSTLPVGLFLALLGGGALLLNKALAVRVPPELLASQPDGELYLRLRRQVFHDALRWYIWLLFTPVAVYELLQLVPYLLPQTSFAVTHNWWTYGPTLASWVAVVLLLAALVQYLALTHRDRHYRWHCGVLAAAVVFIIVVWMPVGMADTWARLNIPLLVFTVVVLAAAWLVRRRTRSVPADFREQIAG